VQEVRVLPTVGRVDIDGACGSRDTSRLVTYVVEGSMRIRNLMSTDVPMARSEETVRDAARRMDEAHVKVLPVCEGDRLVGVLTDWDVISAVADGGSPDIVFVRDYMSVNVVTVTPGTGLAEAGELMAHRRIHHLVVCDDDRFAGIVHLDVEWSELGRLGAPHATFAATV
jgi:CBS domain-containing protein